MPYRLRLLTMILGWSISSVVAQGQMAPPAQDHALHFKEWEIARAPLVPELNLGSTFTMEVWVYPKRHQAYAPFMGKIHDAPGRWTSDPWMSYVLQIGPDNSFEFVQSTGQPGTCRVLAAPTAAALNKWTHVAATLSGGTMRLYIDGQQAAATASPGAPSNTTTAFCLGAGANVTGEISAGGFWGALRQARVWNYALSPSEIKTRASQILTGDEPGLVVCWPLDDGEGQTARSVGSLSADLSLGDAGDQNTPGWVMLFLLEAIRDPVFVGTDSQLPEFAADPEDAIPLDYDGDGDLDIIITQLIWRSETEIPITVLRNTDGRSFAAVTDAWVGKIKFVHPRHWATGDFNSDGRTDLVIADHGKDAEPWPGGQSRILMQTPEGTLMDETASRFPTVKAFTHNIAAGDINGDGYPDIYMGNTSDATPVGPSFYVNNGAGVFSRDPSRIPRAIAAFQRIYTASALVDVDNDGDLDLILGGLPGAGSQIFFPKDALLLNDGSGVFAHAAASAMPDRVGGPTAGTVNICPGDFDNDGWIDLLMATTSGGYDVGILQLLLNNHDGTFRDATDRIPQENPAPPSSGSPWIRLILPGDFNNDGWLDFLAVGMNCCPTRLFYNAGNAPFIDMTDYVLPPLDEVRYTVADFSGDGRTDIVQINDSELTATLLINARDVLRVGGDINPTEDFESQGFSTFAWQQEDDAPWQITSSDKHAGLYSARAGSIDDNQVSALKLTRTCQAGTIRFFLKTSCEPFWDKLVFRIDGTHAGEWSGETGWTEASYPVQAGGHTFVWSYVKDGSSARGEDTAWLDDIVFPPE